MLCEHCKVFLWEPRWQNRAKCYHCVHILILKPVCMINICKFLNLTNLQLEHFASQDWWEFSSLWWAPQKCWEWKSDTSNGLSPAMTTEADCKFYYFIIDKYLEQIQINSHASLSNPKTLQLLQGISRCYWKSENKFKMGSSNQDSGFLAIKQNIEVSNTKKFINSSCSRFLMVALILP